MAVRDVENLMDQVKDAMIANLPAKLIEINTEKGDSLLEPFVPASYFVNKPPNVQAMPHYNVSFVQYIKSMEPKANNSQNAITVNIAVNANIATTGQCNDDIIGWRYQRALLEVYESNIANDLRNTTSDLVSTDIFELDGNKGLIYIIPQIVFDVVIC